MRRVHTTQRSAAVFVFCAGALGTALSGCPGVEEGLDSGSLATDDAGTLPEDTSARDAGRDTNVVADAGTDAFIVCTATEFREAAGTCAALTVCSATEFESTAATATTNRVCTALTVCSGTEFESTAATTTTNRVCAPITTCTATQYEMAAPTSTSDRACAPLTVCSATEYETMAATATSDRQCMALTVCSATQYQTTAPTTTSDRGCTALTACTATQYQSTAPTATSNRACSALTVCTATQQQTTAPTATSNRVCGACGAGTSNCDLDVSNGCEVNTNTSSANCGVCGNSCALDNTCGGGRCAICTPVVVSLPASAMPPAPPGTGARCFASGSSFTTADCQVVQCGQLNTWALSYTDNRGAFNVVTYTPSGTIVRQTERSGSRYWWSSAVNAGPQTVTFFGQATGSVTIPWSELRL